jgi:diguanylate cyclase (GGDEF)-like protein
MKLWEREDQDPVTGARARKVLFQHGRFLLDWAVRYDRPVGLLLIQMDDYASVIRQYGHPFADSVLAAVSNRLRVVSRRTDWVMRNGADSFAVLVLGTPRAGLRVLASKILDQMRASHFVVSGKTIPLTASLGLCSYPARGLEEPSVELMLQFADEALAKAREVGGNCCIEAETGDS